MDACDVARRALELAESRSRRQGVDAFVGRLKAAGLDACATDATSRASAPSTRS